MTFTAGRASIITRQSVVDAPDLNPPEWPATPPRSRRAAAWYAVFAVYAGGVALFSGPGRDRCWGIWASFGYAVAAVLAAVWPDRRGRLAAHIASLAGALVR